MNIPKHLISCIFFLIIIPASYSQQSDTIIELKAFRQGRTIDPITGEAIGFSLCGDDVSTDKARFFSILSGCERNQHLLVGKYSYSNDTFVIEPFDFILESPFVKVYKKNQLNLFKQFSFCQPTSNP